MMYSLTPFPIVDTLNDHTGFYTILILSVVFVLFLWMLSISINDNTGLFLGIPSFLVLCLISGYISFTTGKIEVPVNEQVVGELVLFDKVEYSTTCSAGKVYISCIKTKGVVSYRLSDNSVVSFDATTGVSYPQQAILYKKD